MLRQKSVLVPLYTPQTEHELAWDRSRASEVTDLRLSREMAITDRIKMGLMSGRYVDDELNRKWQKAEVVERATVCTLTVQGAGESG